MKKTYHMAFVTAPGRIEFRDRILPDLDAHSVLVKVKAVSICGGDLHIFKGKHPFVTLPVPVGHELSGEVLKIGKNVSIVKEGDRVAVEPAIKCGKCIFCRRGEYNLCPNISVQYRKGQGAFTPYFVVNENMAHRLPQNISYEEGALIEPLAVAIHAVRKGEIQLGQSAAIFGAGPIGLMILLLIRLSGNREVFVVDIKGSRLEKAKELGAMDVINSSRQDPVEYILNKTGRLGVDKAFEAVGIEKTLVESLKVLTMGGQSIVAGIFENPDIQIPVNIFIQKEITLMGSQGGFCRDFQIALKLLEKGGLKPGEIITHTLPLSALQEAFELLMNPDGRAIKIVIQMD